MPEKKSGRIPTKGRGETSNDEATDVERQASSADTDRVPADERESEQVHPSRRDLETDEEVE
jgi:hypothetical protein